jgi:hypothetical protein
MLSPTCFVYDNFHVLFQVYFLMYWVCIYQPSLRLVLPFQYLPLWIYFLHCQFMVCTSFSIDLYSLIYLTIALSSVVNTLSPADVLNVMHHNNSVVSASCAHFFQSLISQARNSTSYSDQLEPFFDIIMPIIVHALSCLNHSDLDMQACGMSILASLVENGSIYLCIFILYSLMYSQIFLWILFLKLMLFHNLFNFW